MPNMSYCRFENTFKDLDECYESINFEDPDKLSDSEAAYRKRLIDLCGDIWRDFGDQEEE